MVVRRLEVPAFGGPETIQLVEDAFLPQPGRGEVRIRVEASSLVFTDMLIRRNLYPVLKLKTPLTLGYDVIGHVEALGDEVTSCKPGDRVADMTQIGGNATHVVLPAAGLVPVPETLDATRAEPLILSYLTAYQALFREAEVTKGAKVLVYGASGAVGLAALDLCRTFGLRAVGVASGRRRAVVMEAGAEFVAHDSPDAAAQLDGLARERGGFDAILDTARSEPLSVVLRRLSPNGRFVALGFSAAFRGAGGNVAGLAGLLGKVKLGIEFVRIKSMAAKSRTSKRVSFYDVSGRRAAFPERFREDLVILFNLLADGRIAPRVQRVFTIEEAREAHRLIEAGQVEGRLVLDLRAT